MPCFPWEKSFTALPGTAQTRHLFRSEDGGFGVGEFIVAAMVAAFVDQLLSGGEVGVGGVPRIRRLAEEEAGAVQVEFAMTNFIGPGTAIS